MKKLLLIALVSCATPAAEHNFNQCENLCQVTLKGCEIACAHEMTWCLTVGSTDRNQMGFTLDFCNKKNDECVNKCVGEGR